VSSPPYIYNLPSGYFKKEITGQHWSGPKWQIDYKIKGKKRNVSSSSEYSINHQDPKVDGTTRIFHNHQKTQRADSLKKNKIPSIIRTQRLMEQQEYSIIIRRPKEEIHDEGEEYSIIIIIIIFIIIRDGPDSKDLFPPSHFGLKFLKIHEAASPPPPPPPSDLSVDCLVG